MDGFPGGRYIEGENWVDANGKILGPAKRDKKGGYIELNNKDSSNEKDENSSVPNNSTPTPAVPPSAVPPSN